MRLGVTIDLPRRPHPARPAPSSFKGDAPCTHGRIPSLPGELRAHAGPPHGAGTLAHRARAFQSRCRRLRRRGLSSRHSGGDAAVRCILESSRSLRAHRPGDRDAMGLDLRAHRGGSRRRTHRGVPGKHSVAGSGTVPRFRPSALACQQERATVRARRGVPRGRSPAGVRKARRSRLPDAHHRGLRQRQVRDRRLRGGAGGRRVLSAVPGRDVHRLPGAPAELRSRRTHRACPGSGPSGRTGAASGALSGRRQRDRARDGAVSSHPPEAPRSVDPCARARACEGAGGRARGARPRSAIRRPARSGETPRRPVVHRRCASIGTHRGAGGGSWSGSRAGARVRNSDVPGHPGRR